MSDNETVIRKVGSTRARKVWKVLTIFVTVTCLACFAIHFSMYFWPGIPSSPQPSEGRVYPLNNHGHYTYMNRQEYLLNQWSFWIFPALFLPAALIEYFVDPLNRKRRWRPVHPPRPW